MERIYLSRSNSELVKVTQKEVPTDGPTTSLSVSSMPGHTLEALSSAAGSAILATTTSVVVAPSSSPLSSVYSPLSAVL